MDYEYHALLYSIVQYCTVLYRLGHFSRNFQVNNSFFFQIIPGPGVLFLGPCSICLTGGLGGPGPGVLLCVPGVNDCGLVVFVCGIGVTGDSGGFSRCIGGFIGPCLDPGDPGDLWGRWGAPPGLAGASFGLQVTHDPGVGTPTRCGVHRVHR